MRNLEHAVVYEIYIKSFMDSDGDGIGDLLGIYEKLPYLKELGVDYIWITPFYESPLKDFGYDVSNYKKIDPRLGDFKILKDLIKKAEDFGIGIMLDMVFNHSSTEHEWFKKAMEGDEKYRNYYIFKEGKNGTYPTNWISKFGGPAWKKVEGKENEYYLHLFHETQGDLNWENVELREEIFDIMKFWMDLGVKGFRFDVINLISKPEIFKDSTTDDGRHFYTDGPKIHEYLKELNSKTFGLDNSILTVGEMSSTSIEDSIKYSNKEEKELSMVFTFHHLKVDYENGDKWTKMPFDFLKLKEILSTWQIKMSKGRGWNAQFLSNHDQPRQVSRFGSDDKYHLESGKMLATAYFLLRGTPYIYQGEEIGMTNAYFKNIEDYKDVESLNYYEILKKEGLEEKEILEILSLKSRDNARTPMQWDNTKNFGFSKKEPWISNGNGKKVTVVDNLKDENSILNYYKKLIELRHEDDVLAYGNYEELLIGHEKIYAYKRSYNNKNIYVVLNFYGENILKSDEGIKKLKEILSLEKILGNYEKNNNDINNNNNNNEEIGLRPYECLVLKEYE